MMNKLKQVASFLNLPVIVVVVCLTIICFVIVKLIRASFFPKSSKKGKNNLPIKDKDGSVKGLNRKKRSKKQRSIEITSEKKQTEVTDEDKAFAAFHANKKSVSVPTLENERASQLNKKHDKKKGKSKKKKLQTDENDVIAHSVAVVGTRSMVDEEGEWQTVRNKEQKLQRKEKKRQDEAAVTPFTAPVKVVAPTPYTPAYTSIPSTAKDVAPRFARAAGEEWQEGASKRQSVNNVTKSTTIVNRSPMLPATAQQQPASKWAPTTTSAHKPDIWESKTTTPLTFPSTQDTWSSNKNNALNWGPTAKASNWSTKPAAPAWDSAGSPVLDQPEWHGDSKSEEWVHVTTPSPTSAPISETWATASDVYQQALHSWPEVRIPTQSIPVVVAERPRKESFRMEPEGLSVSSMDPDDPWNMDAYAKQGDWSPPEAHWSNPNEEWSAPPPIHKPRPTYFDESSDDEKVTPVAPFPASAAPHVVVGAGSDFLQSQNQQANKKARRRRKKKQTDVSSDATVKETLTVTPPTIEDIVKPQQPNSTKAPSSIDALDDIQSNEVWSMPKQSKKKKPRVRKAE